MSNVIHANESEFKDLLNSGETVFVDFFATWCGPCKMLAPSIEKLADEHPEVKVVKIDTDQIPSLAMEYQVQSIPTLIAFKNGQPVNRQMGFIPYEALEAMIK
ncbi:MAG: thioredoxin [Coprobacillus sp.]